MRGERQCSEARDARRGRGGRNAARTPRPGLHLPPLTLQPTTTVDGDSRNDDDADDDDDGHPAASAHQASDSHSDDTKRGMDMFRSCSTSLPSPPLPSTPQPSSSGNDNCLIVHLQHEEVARSVTLDGPDQKALAFEPSPPYRRVRGGPPRFRILADDRGR